MNVNPIVIAIPIYFLLIAIEIIVHNRQAIKSYRLNDAFANISCGILSQITGAFLMVGLFGLYTWVEGHLSFFDLPIRWWAFVLAFLMFDFMYYWAHRLSHEINLFWGGHSVHHQSEEYNLTVALRQSSTQILWTFLFYLPLALIGIDPFVFVISQGVNLLYQFWIHTESIKKLPKWFEWVFNTPSHHRVHHARNNQYIDKNHGGTLIIWDRLFRTFEKEEEKPVYGITKPLNSWNPLWANFAHYIDIVKNISPEKGFRFNLGLLFKKPGWYEKQAVQRVDPSKKFDTRPPKKLNSYVVVHFLILLCSTLYFLLIFKELSYLEKVVLAALIVVSASSIGMVFDNYKRAGIIEIFRTLLVAISFAILWWNSLNLVIVVTSLAVLSFSMLWLRWGVINAKTIGLKNKLN